MIFAFIMCLVSSNRSCNEEAKRGDKIIQRIMKKMTLDEKLGQLTQINIGELVDKQTNQVNLTKLQYYILDRKVGSFFNNLSDKNNIPPASREKWKVTINMIQKLTQQTKLKIPIIYGLDSIHGANYVLNATILPQQIAIGTTFNTTIARRIAEITAKDTRAVGAHWNFSPILDIAVNKQWPRVYETFSEDPYLTSKLGSVMIKGYQGDKDDCMTNLKRGDKVVATMKHFIGYSASRSGNDVDGSWMGPRVLNDYFRPPYEAAIKAGVGTVMESYSDIEGDHVVASKELLHQLLRKDMKFKGVLVTDWNQIEKLHKPIHVANSLKEAVRLCMKTGSLDISMIPNNADFIDYLRELILKDKAISMRNIDINVKRVLKLKFQLGLLDSPGYVKETEYYKSIGSKEDNEESLNAARESIIMLKNEQLLPLSKDKKVLVVGPTADSLRFLTGGWTFQWQGPKNDNMFYGQGTTILQGIQQHNKNTTFISTIDIYGNPVEGALQLTELSKKAEDFDVVVICLGEKTYAEYKGNVGDMKLPKGQNDLLDSLVNSSKPLILISSQGRPRILSDGHKKAKSILINFLAGPHAGLAIADIIFGKVNPSGKLPLTYSNKPNDNNLNYYRRFNEVYDPEWEFGHGLSYSKFEYKNLRLSDSTMTPGSKINVKVTVVNQSDIRGKESVLLFIQDTFRSTAPEVKKLRKFKKIELEPRESKVVQFTIKEKDLAFWGLDNKRIVEDGHFMIFVSQLEKQFKFVSGNKRKFVECPFQ